MHPEVESKIREQAGNFVQSMSDSDEPHPFYLAKENGYICDEDLKFLGVVHAAGSIALEDLIDIEDFTTIYYEGAQMTFVDQDSLEFKEKESKRQYKLISQLYNCSPEEVEDKWENIIINVDRYLNDQAR